MLFQGYDDALLMRQVSWSGAEGIPNKQIQTIKPVSQQSWQQFQLITE